VRHLLVTALAASLVFPALPACAASHDGPRVAKAKKTPPPPPPPPAPSSAPAAAPVAQPVTEVVEILEQTHPDFLVQLQGIGDKAASAASAPARDPIRAEKFRQALDGAAILAELSSRLSNDPASSLPAVRTWLTSEEGKAFAAARKHAIEVRRSRQGLEGPSIERRQVCRRLVMALNDGRYEGLIDYSVTTQAFLGVGAAGKATGDIHRNLIAQGPWVLDRASDLGMSTSPWTLASLESVISFWESPAGKDYVAAIDKHLTEIIQARIAEAEGRTAAAPSPAPAPAP
jgi:hypothetical protein